MILTSLIAAARLAAALTSREVPIERAVPFALAATILCADPALCGAIAIGESRLVVDAVNPRTGTWGVGQVSTPRPQRITVWNGTAAMVARLEDARGFCAWRRDPSITCELAAYASGPRGVRAMESGERWPSARAQRVLARSWVIRRRMGWQPGNATRAPEAATSATAERAVREVAPC